MTSRYFSWLTLHKDSRRHPARVVIGRDDRFLPASFQHRVARHRLGIAGDEGPGGHLVALSQPAALVERLEAYQREITQAT